MYPLYLIKYSFLFIRGCFNKFFKIQDNDYIIQNDSSLHQILTNHLDKQNNYNDYYNNNETKIKNKQKDNSHKIFSIAPGGCHILYTSGIIKYISEHKENMKNIMSFGNSTGSIVSTFITSDISFSKYESFIYSFLDELSECKFRNVLSLLSTYLHKILPDDTHILCSSNNIILTTGLYINYPSRDYYTFYFIQTLLLGLFTYFNLYNLSIINCIITSFVFINDIVKSVPCYFYKYENKKQLIECILCSCSIPFIQDQYKLRTPPNNICCLLDEHKREDIKYCIDGVLSIRHCIFGSYDNQNKSNNQNKNYSTITLDWNNRHYPKPCIYPTNKLETKVFSIPEYTLVKKIMNVGYNDVKDYFL